MGRLIRAALGGGAMVLIGAVQAGASGDLERLLGYLDIAGTVEVMRDEGLRYGDDLAREMLPEADAPGWKQVVARIYDADRMYALIAASFEETLAQTDLAPLLAFYETEAANGIVQLELAARRALLEPGVEAVAQARFERAREEGAEILGRIDRLVKDSDLIEMNVAGTLNASLMFYRGLSDGGAYDMSEEDMLSDIWMQEEDVRKETMDWLNGFLLMAYDPVKAADLDAYSELYRTEEGRDLNRAMFAGFDRMYEEISYLLGRSVAQYLHSEKL